MVAATLVVALVVMLTGMPVHGMHMVGHRDDVASACGGEGWTLRGKKCYFFNRAKSFGAQGNRWARWSEARAYCLRKGGDLAQVRNKDENTDINALTQSTKSWIGLTRTPLVILNKHLTGLPPGSEPYKGPWREFVMSSDLSKATYTPWKDPSQPTNQEYCVTSESGKWQSERCWDFHPFVCEKTAWTDPRPDLHLCFVCEKTGIYGECLKQSRNKKCPCGWAYDGKQCVGTRTDINVNYFQANQWCAGRYANLATIDKGTVTAIMSFMNKGQPQGAWVGLFRQVQGTQFAKWTDGTKVTHHYWKVAVPDPRAGSVSARTESLELISPLTHDDPHVPHRNEKNFPACTRPVIVVGPTPKPSAPPTLRPTPKPSAPPTLGPTPKPNAQPTSGPDRIIHSCPLRTKSKRGVCMTNAECQYSEQDRQCVNRIQLVKDEPECESLSESECKDSLGNCEWSAGYKCYPGYPEITKNCKSRGAPPCKCLQRHDENFKLNRCPKPTAQPTLEPTPKPSGQTGDMKTYLCPLRTKSKRGVCMTNAECQYSEQDRQCVNRIQLVKDEPECESLSESECKDSLGNCEWSAGYKCYPGYPEITKNCKSKGAPPCKCLQRHDENFKLNRCPKN